MEIALERLVMQAELAWPMRSLARLKTSGEHAACLLALDVVWFAFDDRNVLIEAIYRLLCRLVSASMLYRCTMRKIV